MLQYKSIQPLIPFKGQTDSLPSHTVLQMTPKALITINAFITGCITSVTLKFLATIH